MRVLLQPSDLLTRVLRFGSVFKSKPNRSKKKCLCEKLQKIGQNPLRPKNAKNTRFDSGMFVLNDLKNEKWVFGSLSIQNTMPH